MPDTAPAALPLEIRALGLLLALDALGGIWLALHDPGALSAYLAPQLPAVGIGGLAWGFLPKRPKDAFGEWLAGILAKPAFLWSVLVLGGIGLALSGLTSTLSIRSVDPQGSAQVRFVEGMRESPPDSAALSGADTKRLNRVTTPIHWFHFGSPLGKTMWVHTANLVSGNKHVRPWVPTSLDYPDDFEEMVTIAVLPEEQTLEKLAADTATFSLFALSGTDSTPIARGILGEHGTFLAFTSPPVPAAAVVDRWQKILIERNPNDPNTVPLTLKEWLAADTPDRWIRTVRPLVVGQIVSWSITSKAQTGLASGRMTLNDHVSDLFVSF